MSYFQLKYLPSYFMLGIGFWAIYESFFRESMTIFITGILVILAGVFYLMFLSVVELFKKDKEINISRFRQEGYQIVTCKECEKENLLVDQYCIHCGEKLESEKDEKLQEEH